MFYAQSTSAECKGVAEHPTGVTEMPYLIHEATHGTELAHFQNDPLMTEAAEEAIIHDSDNSIIFDLF